MKKLVVITVVAIVLVSVWLVNNSSKSGSSATTSNQIVSPVAENSPPLDPNKKYDQVIILNDYTYTPKEFTVVRDTTVEILLKNSGQYAHALKFDDFDFSSGNVLPKQSQAVTFTTPSKPGQYVFRSTSGGIREKEMTGTMIVE